MEIRDREGQISRERVIEFVSIFSGGVTIGTIFPCSTRTPKVFLPQSRVVDCRKMLITVHGERRRKLEHTARLVIVIY